jgi:hypothetical protein
VSWYHKTATYYHDSWQSGETNKRSWTYADKKIAVWYNYLNQWSYSLNVKQIYLSNINFKKDINRRQKLSSFVDFAVPYITNRKYPRKYRSFVIRALTDTNAKNWKTLPTKRKTITRSPLIPWVSPKLN